MQTYKHTHKHTHIQTHNTGALFAFDGSSETWKKRVFTFNGSTLTYGPVGYIHMCTRTCKWLIAEKQSQDETRYILHIHGVLAAQTINHQRVGNDSVHTCKNALGCLPTFVDVCCTRTHA